MKTTEIFVELVLVGLMAIAVVALPFLPEFIGISSRLSLGSGAILITFAYLFGIVFDRVADTFVEDLESHNRARFALKINPNAKDSDDPFEEDVLHISAIIGNPAMAEKIRNYSPPLARFGDL